MTTSSITSDLKAASAQIVIGKNRINAITMLGDNTNLSSVVLWDNAAGAASGKVLAKVIARTSDAQNHIIFTNPVVCENGIYAQLTGTGGNYIIYYGG